MLNVYSDLKDIPDGIRYVRDNDIFFNANTKLGNDRFTEEVLRKIDLATVVSSDTFIGRDKSLGSLYRIFLSTGSKTLLNIYSHPDICFNADLCGDNAIFYFSMLDKGYVFFSKNDVAYAEEGTKCNIKYNERLYHDFNEFLDAVGVR